MNEILVMVYIRLVGDDPGDAHIVVERMTGLELQSWLTGPGGEQIALPPLTFAKRVPAQEHQGVQPCIDAVSASIACDSDKKQRFEEALSQAV